MLKLQQLDQLVTNYEALSDKYRADAQDNAYKDDNSCLYLKKKVMEKAAEEGNDTPKHYIGVLLET